MFTPIDIEDAVQQALSETMNASATPLPADFADRLPFALPTRTGGTEHTLVSEQHAVSLDVYAKTWCEAVAWANSAISVLRGYKGGKLGDATCYDVTVSALPYNNPDPRHEDVPRVTTNLLIVTRNV